MESFLLFNHFDLEMMHISALLLLMQTSHVALSQSSMAVKAVSDWGTLHCSRATSSLNVRLSLPETKPETNPLPYKIMSSPQLFSKRTIQSLSQSLHPAEVQVHLIFLHCASLHFPRYCTFFLNRLNICGNAASSKSIGTIFPIASPHFMSLCHILVILAVFQTFSFLYLL